MYTSWNLEYNRCLINIYYFNFLLPLPVLLTSLSFSKAPAAAPSPFWLIFTTFTTPKLGGWVQLNDVKWRTREKNKGSWETVCQISSSSNFLYNFEILWGGSYYWVLVNVPQMYMLGLLIRPFKTQLKMRKYLQKTHLIKDCYLKYTKNS